MRTVNAVTVRDALPRGLRLLANWGKVEESRNGKVIVADCPVTTIYSRPQHRVLLSAVRDANPFFHLAEALWMLAGRRDAGFLNNFVANFGERYAEPPGLIIHGAYGHRWRSHFTEEVEDVPPGAAPVKAVDQLDLAVETLRKDPGSRQVVIQMWDIDVDWKPGLKDRPCNTQIYLRLRNGETIRGGEPTYDQFLDITVTCRSNDIIWGAYGANAVHFAFLQEYLAARLGAEVGYYYQVSNNYHAYVSEIDRLWEKISPHDTMNYSGKLVGLATAFDVVGVDAENVLGTKALVDDPTTFDQEVRWLLDLYEQVEEVGHEQNSAEVVLQLKNTFLSRVAWPMIMAHRAHKLKSWVNVDLWMSMVAAQDWQRAGHEWSVRRRK